MAITSYGAPLLAIDAVVLDTETTGLDPSKAWVVEFAAVRLIGGRLASDQQLHSFIRPPAPIPATATAVHRIDDAKVAAAPAFAEAWPKLREFVGGNILIGHTLGFDLAVLKRECARAALPMLSPPMLDTRLLAEVAAPNLADFTIESLAAWLELEIDRRHSALGDAITTARIFTALVPKLRDGGIRTVGEAMQACRTLTDVLDQQHRAGWVEAASAPARTAAEQTLRRIDSYPYRHRVRDVMRTPAEYVTADVSMKDALARLMEKRISSLYVRPQQPDDSAPLAADTGIVTERDLLRAIASHGAAALAMPVGRAMSSPLSAVPADAFVYRAVGRMNRLKVRHLGVADEAGRVIGALSARDLLRLRAGEAIALGDQIDQANDSHALAAAWAKLPEVTAALLAEEIGARNIAAVISRELGALTGRAAAVAEQGMRAAGLGEAPCPYAIAVLGSAGRGESLLAMDQDNALVFAEGEPDGVQDLWFAQLGNRIADILDETGVPYCKGGVMAKNPNWRGSVATWRSRVGDWIGRSSPADLLSVDIFFDMRPVHGDGSLCNALWHGAFDAARGHAGFAKLLAESAGDIESGLGLFGRFKTSNGRIDLKKCGLFGVVTAARVLAIRHHVVERSTPDRLAGIKALGIGSAGELEALTEAQATFLDLIVAQQVEDIERGIAPSNAVAIKRLSARDRDRLRTALSAVAHLKEFTRDLLFGG